MSEDKEDGRSQHGGSNKVGPETTGGTQENTEKKEYARKTLLIVAAVSFMVALLLGVIVTVIVAAVLGKQVVDAQVTTDMYTAIFSMDRPFVAALSNDTSQEFHVLAEETCNKIKDIYGSSSLQESYLGCLVNSFSAGSIKVNSTILFDNRVDVTTKNSPAGSSLTRKEYTVLDILETGGKESIANFIPGSTTVEESDTPSDLVTLLAKVNTINSNENCDDQPCLNGGTCTDGLDKFFCGCTSAYTGSTCAADVPECPSTTCSENEQCIEIVGGGTTCICDTGYTSANCQATVDDCSDNPCSYGNCTDLVGNFSCTCDPGYTGYRCNVDIVECGPTTCKGNGECMELEGEGTRCICYEGYTSADCGQSIDDCSDNPCSYGNCTDLVSDFNCTCEPGYTGYRCDVDIIECDPTTCKGNGECIELDGEGTRCICYEGYTSADCSQNIDDCSDNPCSYGNCTDLVGNFSCTCEPGYTGYRCDVGIAILTTPLAEMGLLPTTIITRVVPTLHERATLHTPNYEKSPKGDEQTLARMGGPEEGHFVRENSPSRDYKNVISSSMGALRIRPSSPRGSRGLKVGMEGGLEAVGGHEVEGGCQVAAGGGRSVTGGSRAAAGGGRGRGGERPLLKGERERSRLYSCLTALGRSCLLAGSV